MRKITSLLTLLCLFVGTAWGQNYQKVPHAGWKVTALNEAGTSGREGGVAFLVDEDGLTFYHSNWGAGYADGTSGKNKGQDGVQAFMIEMPEVTSFDKLTYTGRSNGENNWATKLRVYAYETLPTGLTTNLSSLSFTQKEELLSKSNANLGTPIFDNNETPWPNDRNHKDMLFVESKSAKYILVVADATTGDNGYFTCSDFSLWQKTGTPAGDVYTVSATTGSYPQGGNWNKSWVFTTNETLKAELKLDCNVNNMAKDATNLKLYVGQTAPSTYTLSVPDGYLISGYSFDMVKDGEYSVYASVVADGVIYRATSDKQTVFQTNINAKSVSFRMDGSNKGIVASDFKVYVIKIPVFTYSYIYNSVVKYSETVSAMVGSSYPEVKKIFGVNTTTPSGTVKAADDGTTIEIECVKNLPFVAADSYKNITTWYHMNIRDDSPTYMAYESGVNYIKATELSVPADKLDEYSWAFIGDNPFDGFAIVNKAAGETMILSAPEAPNANKEANQLARMVEATSASGNKVWNLVLPTHSGAASGAFYIEHPDAKAYAFNRQSFDDKNVVCYWTGRDTGSSIQLVVRPSLNDAFMALIAQAENLVPDAPSSTAVGRYTDASITNLKTAIAKAKTVGFAEQSDLDDLQAAINALETVALKVGNYYRIKSTTRGTFTGLDNYTMRVKNVSANDADATQIWKYEQDGDNYYMKNVFSGMYPQTIPAGGDKTAFIGSSKDFKFTHVLHAETTKTTDAAWNIFFGGTQVNIEPNGNFNYWYGDNAHHHIYEVNMSDDDIAAMCVNWYNANVFDASAYNKIEITDGAEVISPSEFAAPNVINAAIDKLNISGAVSQAAIHNLFAALESLVPYKDAVASYGELLSIAYTPKAQWGTIMLPINWANPEGWERYECASQEDGVLNLTAQSGSTKNTPMIIKVAEEKVGKTYQLIGYSNGAGTENVTKGLLTGVFEDNTKVPEGSYVLAKYNEKIGFYPVASGAEYDAAKYKCYLTLPSSSARYNALFFDGEETGISSVESNDGSVIIYNVAGQRLNKMQKGLNIVGGKIVIK